MQSGELVTIPGGTASRNAALLVIGFGIRCRSYFHPVTLSEAAITAVMNRANISSFAPPGDELAVNEQKAIDQLGATAGIADAEALTAARDAIVAVGGRLERRRKRGGIAAGRMRVHNFEAWWVPDRPP